jgi:hypothetical protein
MNTASAAMAIMMSVAKLIDVKSAIPEQDRSGDQKNSPRRA